MAPNPESATADKVSSFLEEYGAAPMECSRTTVVVLSGLLLLGVLTVIIRPVVACTSGDSDFEELPGDEEADIEELGPCTYEDYLDDNRYYDEVEHENEKLPPYEEARAIESWA